ncbi:MAG: heparinase II/III family protein [Candidatus Puniceispirillaceae bacterium]
MAGRGDGHSAAITPMRLSGLERLFRRSGLFGWQIRGAARGVMRTGLQDPWQGDQQTGARLAAGQIIPARDDEDSARFTWLCDLRAEGGDTARVKARELITRWISDNQNWHLPGWRPDIMGQRLARLALNFGWYGVSADEGFQRRLAGSVEMQLRCLAIDWRRMRSLDDQIGALRGLALAETAMGAEAARLNALVDILMPKLTAAILPDGGHVSRMPDRHILLLRQLVEIRMATSLAGADGAAIGDMIERMGGLVRMWRHGDGRIAHFNGAGTLPTEIVEETLARSSSRSRTMQQAPYSGFLRIGSGRTVVIMDAGEPATMTDGTVIGYGTLGFEMSVGPTQLIVNSGQMMGDPTLRRVMCSTAAHSTVGLDNQNSSRLQDGRLATVSGVEVGEAQAGLLAVASHDGFESSHGILHHRKLYLRTGGANLRGSDTLEYTGAPGEIPSLAFIRFHLHPRVTAAPLPNGTVLMKIRGSRVGWTFKASGGTVEVDNSVYFEDGLRQASQQIIVKAMVSDIRTTGSHEVKWAFTRTTQ